MRVTFSFREGDIVFAKFIPDVPLEVTGLHRINGGNSYSCFDGENEFLKYEHQLFVKPKRRGTVGFKSKMMSKEKEKPTSKSTIVKEIGRTDSINVEMDF